VNETGLEKGSKKVKTESGNRISSAYKTNVYVSLFHHLSAIFSEEHCVKILHHHSYFVGRTL